MCSIVGWNVRIPKNDIDKIIDSARNRGRDGWGFWIDGVEHRGMGEVYPNTRYALYAGNKVVGNFRATPTTEVESRTDLLQPYQGFVHNGTIANDKQFGKFPIDSMVIPVVAGRYNQGTPKDWLTQLIGSYAIARFEYDKLFLACNYKPIFLQRVDGGVMFASMPYMFRNPEWAVQMPAYSYSYIDGQSIENHPLPLIVNKKAIVACSAGLDSTTVAYILKKQGYDVSLAHFRYGCLAEPQELNRVQRIADHGNFKLVILDLPKVMGGSIVEGCFKSDGVSGAEYAHDWVSARNLLMLSVLTAYAETNNISYIAFGGNLEESGAYADNEEIFAYNFNKLLPNCTQNNTKIELLHPLTRFMKHEIVKTGLEIGVPFDLTWSCYDTKEKHCGQCGPCFMRKMAFERNGAVDPAFGGLNENRT